MSDEAAYARLAPRLNSPRSTVGGNAVTQIIGGAGGGIGGSVVGPGGTIAGGIAGADVGIAVGGTVGLGVGGYIGDKVEDWLDSLVYAKPPENARDPNGPKAPGKPGETEGFVDPKDGENWAPNPNPGRGGSANGWEDEKGRVWCPTGQSPGRAHGKPHWDVQLPNGDYVNVRPGQNINDILKK
jgi:hypothetical protein